MLSIVNQAGLSLFNDKIQFVELAFRNNKYYLENIDEEYFEDNIDFTDEENFIYILQNSFDKLTVRNTINTNYISISLPPELFLTASVPIDTQLSSGDMVKHNEWELNLLFPNIDHKNFTFRSLRSDSSTGELIKNNIYLGIRKSLLKKLHQFSVKNNLALKFVDAANIVSHVIISKSFEIRKNAISVYRSGDHLAITAGNEFKLLYFRNIDISKFDDPFSELNNIINYLTENFIFGESENIYFIQTNRDDKFIGQMQEKVEFKILTADFHRYFSSHMDFENNIFLNNDYNSFFAAASIALRQI